jgi:hypothetical protein
MVCKITSTASGANIQSRSGAALIDLLVASGIASIVLAGLSLLALFGNRSFGAMANYVSLDQYSRNALDKMSREIRQCNSLKAADTNYLWFEDYDGGDLLYFYVPSSRLLYRYKNWVWDGKALLEQCDYLKFSIFQRNPILGSYDQYPAATPDTCKLVQLSWICSRPIVGSGKNTESVQSAKVVIRKK